VKTIRRTQRDPVFPGLRSWSTPFLRRPVRTPMGSSYRQVYAEVITARDKGSRVEYRWEPWVGA
jgi:hypothetical protein